MPQEFLRRDVLLVVDQAKELMRSADNLRKLTNLPGSIRLLSIAITEIETGYLRLKELADQTPESL